MFLKCKCGKVSDLLDRVRSVHFHKYLKISRLLWFVMSSVNWDSSWMNFIQKVAMPASSRALIMNMSEQNSQEHPVCETADLPSSVVNSCQRWWQRQPEPGTVPLRPPASGKLSLLLGWGSFLAPRRHRCQTATQSSARTVEEITT